MIKHLSVLCGIAEYNKNSKPLRAVSLFYYTIEISCQNIYTGKFASGAHPNYLQKLQMMVDLCFICFLLSKESTKS
jgi:hypothetical protein